MQLVMLLGAEVIDKINIEDNNMGNAAYIALLQDALINRNMESLECCADVPGFAFEAITAQPECQRSFA